MRRTKLTFFLAGSILATIAFLVATGATSQILLDPQANLSYVGEGTWLDVADPYNLSPAPKASYELEKYWLFYGLRPEVTRTGNVRTITLDVPALSSAPTAAEPSTCHDVVYGWQTMMSNVAPGNVAYPVIAKMTINGKPITQAEASDVDSGRIEPVVCGHRVGFTSPIIENAKARKATH